LSEKQKILVTSALPYANGPLHIGHLAGAYLPADIYVRYQRLKGNDVVYICGSDEHGVPITIKADQEGVTPQVIIDKYHEMNRNSFERFGMSFDNYSRTSLPLHHETAREFFLDFHNKGILKRKGDKQFYDKKAEMFLPDRYVEGTCPFCKSPGARGDQCENCGRDLNQTELIDPVSKITGKKPVLRETYHWYFPLGDYQEKLQAYIDSHPEWKDNVKNYCYGWFKEGLRDRAVTRDLNWGVRVPLDDAQNKVLYVWFEAVLGYISSTKEWAQKIGEPERWKDYWQDKDCKLIHFVGKDNIVFHAIMFPALLMAREGYVLAENIPANEFLNIQGDKISTSRNYAIWVDEYLESFAPDPLRYCLASIAPETKDADFSWQDFQVRNNAELVGILGNFVNRSLTFVNKHFDNRVPELHQPDSADQRMLNRLSEAPVQIGECLEKFEVRQALKHFMNICRDANKYFNDKEPWKTIKTDRNQCGTTLNVCLQISKTLAVLMAPFMPFSAEKLAGLLNLPPDEELKSWDKAGSIELPAGHQLKKPGILFSKMEDAEIQKAVAKLRGTADEDKTAAAATPEEKLVSFEEFSRIDLRTARVLSAEKVEKADKLLRLKVELGQERRQIIAGVAQHISAENIVGKTVIVVANLKPAKIRGLESQGMLLAVEDDNGALILLGVSGEVAPGQKVR
jgi:methionyl-tRNA synthetase